MSRAFFFYFFASVLLLVSLFPLLMMENEKNSVCFVSAATTCNETDRNYTDPVTGYPRCIKVGLLSKTPNGASQPLTEIQNYWANVLPQRVWNSIKRNVEVRGITIEEVQTDLDWAGGINNTINGTYDIFVSNFWMLASRLGRVDFSQPYMKESWGLLYRVPPLEAPSPIVNWADPFTGETWGLIFVIIVFGGIMLWAAELINHGFGGEAHQNIIRPDEELKDDPFVMLRHVNGGAYFEGFSHAVSHAFGTIFGTFDILPRSFGGWMVSWSLQWFVFVFLASYTANLASFLTLSKSPPIRTPNELFGATVVTIPEKEISEMIAALTTHRVVGTFASNVAGYIPLFEASGAESAALPELDLKEIALTNCDYTYITFDLSVESGFVFRRHGSISNVKAILDEALLQFADFGILSKWVRSGLPPDQCNSDSALENSGAMGLEELGGAFIVALILFSAAILVAVWIWARERWMLRKVHEKFGDTGPHRSDDIDLADGAVDACKDAVDDAKRAAAALIDVLALRTSGENAADDQQAPKKIEISHKTIHPATSGPTARGSGNMDYEQTEHSRRMRNLLLFMHDGIETAEKEEEHEDDDMESDDEEWETHVKKMDEHISTSHDAALNEDVKSHEEEEKKGSSRKRRSSRNNTSSNKNASKAASAAAAAAAAGGGSEGDIEGGMSIKPQQQEGEEMSNIKKGDKDGAEGSSPGSPSPTQTGRIAAKHLAKIRGSVVSVSSALSLAEDSLNRAGRRRYCNIPIDTCNSRDGRSQEPFNKFSSESEEDFAARMKRERMHMHALIETARSANKAAIAAAEASEKALLSSLMQQGRRREVLDRWVRRGFRAAAFLTLLNVSATRRIANESVYVSRMFLRSRRGHLSELSELSALIATEVEILLRSVKEEEAAIEAASVLASDLNRDLGSPSSGGAGFSPLSSPNIAPLSRLDFQQQQQQQQPRHHHQRNNNSRDHSRSSSNNSQNSNHHRNNNNNNLRREGSGNPLQQSPHRQQQQQQQIHRYNSQNASNSNINNAMIIHPNSPSRNHSSQFGMHQQRSGSSTPVMDLAPVQGTEMNF